MPSPPSVELRLHNGKPAVHTQTVQDGWEKGKTLCMETADVNRPGRTRSRRRAIFSTAGVFYGHRTVIKTELPTLQSTETCSSQD